MGKAYTVFFMYTYKHTFPDPGATTTRTITRIDTISANIFSLFCGGKCRLNFCMYKQSAVFFCFFYFSGEASANLKLQTGLSDSRFWIDFF